MPLSQTERDSFYRYASDSWDSHNPYSLEELVVRWRAEAGSEEDATYAENIKAIAAAVRDMEAGDRGRDATDDFHDLRNELKAIHRA